MRLSAEHVDSVIVGAGLVGLTAALLLQQQGKRVCLIEQAAPHGRADTRGIVLSPSSQRLYQQLGLWQEILPHTTPIEAVHISQAGCWGRVVLTATQHHAGRPLGYTLQAGMLKQVLQAQLAAECLQQPAHMTQMKVRTGGWHLGVQQAGHDNVVTTPLLVAADGATSSLRTQLGLTARHIDYRATALVTMVQTSRGDGQTAYERFTEKGVCALLPLADSLKCVWIVPTTQAADFDVVRACQQAFGTRLGTFQKVAPCQQFPLHAVWSEHLIGARAVLLGSAATTLSPVAAQGFNLALRDVAALSTLGAQPADYTATQAWLGAYAASRMPDHRAFRWATDYLQNAFHPGRLWGTLGLQAITLCPGAQHLITRFGTGCLM